MKGLVAALVLLAGASARHAPDAITVSSARGILRVPITAERGFPALAAAQLSSVLAWETVTAPPGMAMLRVAGQSFAFVLDAGFFRHDGRVYTLAAGPFIARDSLFMPLQFVTEYLPRLTARYRYDAGRGRLEELAAPATVRPIPTAPAVSTVSIARRRRTVAIDAGHGGVDVGMSGPLGSRTRFLKEKDVTLAIARLLAAELRGRGFGTFLTRDRDTLIARDERGGIARRAGADVFVSVHVNAANPRWRNASAARGFETYYLAEARTQDEAWIARQENASVRFETDAQTRRGDPVSFIMADLAANEHLRESSQMAEIVQQSLVRVHPAESRGVKQAPFAVLSTSYMPAILIEAGFGSNAAEARYLTSASGQQRLARAMADGIERYLGDYERRLAAGGP